MPRRRCGMRTSGTVDGNWRRLPTYRLITIAKGLTSGYAPLGGVAASEKVWAPYFAGETAPVLRHGLTYSGHATACAVRLANLDILEDEDLLNRSILLEKVLAGGLSRLETFPAVKEVRVGDGFLVVSS